MNRPRGLCWSCYYRPGVKDLYPPTSKYARRGVGNWSSGLEPPDEPTTAVPGTPEKTLVFEERIAAGRGIFHPADARYEGDPQPLEWIEKRKAGAA